MAESQLSNNASFVLADEDKINKVVAELTPFILRDSDIERVMKILHDEMIQGLSDSEEARRSTSLQMENTYVEQLLDGTETDDYLALDLGGTNFRVLLCKMRNGKCESISRNYNVPREKLHGPAIAVFDHLAESIYLFLKEEQLLHRTLPLGFTFSFPMVQKSIKSGLLVTWTKSFACPDGVGCDAVLMLEEAIARRKDISVDVVAVLNDTTGTLLAGSYLDKDCAIGLILGTGCNAAYIEKKSNLKSWHRSSQEQTASTEIVIDTEWGAFGDNGSLDFLKTEYDCIIDQHSNHIGSFTFEKMFSGHYIGDLARLIMLRLKQNSLIFSEDDAKFLQSWKSFTAENLSDISRDTPPSWATTTAILQSLGVTRLNDDDIATVRYICEILILRASHVVSACIATLLRHMDRREVTIAIDGSLYKYHPTLHDLMTRTTAQLAPNTKSRYILAEDGSGRGAAFVAAVATRMRTQHQHTPPAHACATAACAPQDSGGCGSSATN